MGHIYINCKICQRLILQIYGSSSKIYQLQFKCPHWTLEMKSKCSLICCLFKPSYQISIYSSCNLCNLRNTIINKIPMPKNKIHTISIQCNHNYKNIVNSYTIKPQKILK